MAAFPTGLTDYLAMSAARPWSLGAFDCATFMSDWVKLLTGCDPLEGVRGKYTTELQYCRLLRREGGYLASASCRLARVGLHETNQISAGDVAVVLAPTHSSPREQIGAIVVNKTMRAVVTPDLGLVIAPNLPLLRAWTFHG